MGRSAAPTMVERKGRHRGRAVWLYVVDGRNSADLALLDAQGFDTWRGNPGTRSGDLIVMYRTAPFSDIASVFLALGDARPTRKSRDWSWRYAVDLSGGYRLARVIPRDELKGVDGLQHWSFLANARGASSRREDLQEQGVWPVLRRLIEARAPGITEHFGRAWSGRGHRRYVFLSYASEDLRHARKLYEALARQGIDVWLDRVELEPADNWDRRIRSAIAHSCAFVVCVSPSWSRRRSYVKRELEIGLRVAQGRRNFMFPIMVSDGRMPDSLRSFQFTDLTGPIRDDRLEVLATRLRHLVHHPPVGGVR